MKAKRSMALTMAAAMTLGLVVSNGTLAKADDVVEIKFPTYLAGENVGAKFFLPEVERFNEKYEGKYKITVEEVPQASYADKIKQLAQQNKLPVLVHAPGSGGIDTQWFKQVILANDMAYDLSDFAKENHLYGTSGGDTHEQHESNIGKAGMAFPYRIKTEKELANALFRHDGRCIINGVIQPAEPPKPSFYHFAF